MGEEKVEFNIVKSLKYPSNDDSVCRIDTIDALVDDHLKDIVIDESLERALAQLDDDSHLEEVLATDINLKEPNVELKPLPPSLRYEFLGPDETYPVIVSSALNQEQTKKLLTKLKLHRKAIGYTIHDLTGINPSVCMHRINMEDDHKPTLDAQRRLNPTLKEVVWKEIHKLLDAGIIYPISDSKWVSPVHVVPKKGGTTVVKDADGNPIST